MRVDFVAVFAAVLAVGCSADDGRAGPPDETVVGQILYGDRVSDSRNNPGTVAVYHQKLVNGAYQWYSRPCTGVALSRTYVLTALHCVTSGLETDRTKILPNNSLRMTGPDQVSPGAAVPSTGYVIAKEIIGHPFTSAGVGIDAAVIHVQNDFPAMSRPFTTRGIPTFWRGTQTALVGRTVEAFGFGLNEAEIGGLLRRARLPVVDKDVYAAEYFFTATPNLQGQFTSSGDSGGPAFESAEMGIAGVHSGVVSDGHGNPLSQAVGMDLIRGWVKRARHAPGDINRDRRADNGLGRGDIVVVGGPSTNSLPVGLSQGNGAFTQWDAPLGSDFPSWSRQTGAKPVTGDFNGDGYGDVALVGGVGWASIPTAIYTAGSQGGPFFAVNNFAHSGFGATAAMAGVQPVSGDFNGDGWSDIALVGGTQTAVRVAFSNADDTSGTFSVSDMGLSLSFRNLLPTAGARVVSGDFDGDDIDDLALVGAPTFTGIPIAFAASASPNPPFSRFVNNDNAQFVAFAQAPGVRPVVGDYNGDGRDDIALLGGPGWLSIPVAFANDGSGTFTVTNEPVTDIPQFAQAPGVQFVSADYDGDGRDDIAIAGGPGWLSVPVAFSRGDGTFAPTNTATPLSGPAGQPGVRIVSGH